VPNLMYFRVADNQLTGPIPDLSGLPNLIEFYVDFNQLSGPIPALDGLTQLTNFWAQNNQLVGPIPPLDALTSLTWFLVDHNSLNGKVPQPPASLQFARLCPNFLDISPSAPPAIDAAWDAATHFTPWWSENGSRCDILLNASFQDTPIFK
jgi:hypothetical protein